MKQIKILVIFLIICVNLFSQQIDIGNFNYENSRLKDS